MSQFPPDVQPGIFIRHVLISTDPSTPLAQSSGKFMRDGWNSGTTATRFVSKVLFFDRSRILRYEDKTVNVAIQLFSGTFLTQVYGENNRDNYNFFFENFLAVPERHGGLNL